MRLRVFLLVDLLALGFAIATLWLMYHALYANPPLNLEQARLEEEAVMPVDRESPESF